MSSTSSFVLKNETTVVPVVETPTTNGEYYPYYPVVGGKQVVTTTTTSAAALSTTTLPFVGGCSGFGCTGGLLGTSTVVPTTTVVTPIEGTTGLYSIYKYVVDVLNVAEDSYLTGHQIDGRILYPTTGYLYLVWKSLAKLNGYQTVEQMPISFENVEIHRATILALKQQLPLPYGTTKQIEFCVRIVPKTGLFELLEGENVIVTGRVAIHESIAKLEQLKMLAHQHLTHLGERKRVVDLLEQEEFYRELKMRGYEYTGEFQPILRADLEGTCGELLWTGKWIPFLDAMLQLNTWSQYKRVGGTNGLLLPTRIRSIKIDPFAHFHVQKLVTKMVKSMSVPSFGTPLVRLPYTAGTGLIEKPYVLPVVFEPMNSRIVCGGVEILGVNTTCTGIQSWLPTPATTVTKLPYETVLPTTYTAGLPVTPFVPYVEKHFDDEYVLVDKCLGGVESTIVQEPSLYRQNREFLEFYLNECKRYVSHILRKVEQPTIVVQQIVPTMIPKTLEQQLETLKITTPVVYEKEWISTPYGKLLETGKLLKLLVHVANIDSTDGLYLPKIQKIFTEKFAYLRALEEDSVLNLINNRSYYLKNILDTVLENTHHIYTMPRGIVEEPRKEWLPRLKVLEISPSVGQFFGAKVSNLMKLYPMNRVGQIDYHYVPSMVGVHPNTFVPEEYIMELNKQLPYEIKKVEFNFGLKNGQLITEVPSHLREYDLVILNGSLSSLLPYVESEYELKKWLQTVVMEKVLKPQGFLFVHEYTNSFDLLSQLTRLEHSIVLSTPFQPNMTTPFKFTTGRFPYQKYLSEMKWRQIIEECGFYPVSMKSDVELSSMFLYRRPYTFAGLGLGLEEKIWIDECIEREPTMWVKKMRSLLAEKAIERLWLLSEREPTVEVVSWINGLRREMGGEKIRCLFAADRLPVGIYGQRYMVPSMSELITPTTTTQWTELFPIVRKADLIMNVFRAGQWGSFRPVSPISGYGYPIVPATTFEHNWIPTPYKQRFATPYEGKFEGKYEAMISPCYEPEYEKYEKYEYPLRPITPTSSVVYRREKMLHTTTSTMGVPTTTVFKPTTGMSRLVFNPLQTYIITCGLGSFGLELAEWAVERGARRIILTSKYGVRTGYQARKLRILRDEYNVHIQVLQVDVREEVECLHLIKEALQMSVENKIGGIFHLASAVEDCLFEQQYPVGSTQIGEVLKKITEYRYQGAYLLDKLTRVEGIMDELAYFVVVSSAIKETSSLLEKICESRRRFGRHALSVNWGVPTIDNGLMLEQMFAYDNVVEPLPYVLPNRIFSCLKIMENVLLKTIVEPTMWSHYVPVDKYWQSEMYPTAFNTTSPMWTSPMTTTSPLMMSQLPYKSLVEVLMTLLGVKEMSSRFVGAESMITLGELGLDSVLAYELKQLFEHIYQFPVSVRDIHTMTLEKLRLIEAKYPYGIFELYQPRVLTYLPRIRSVIPATYIRKTMF